MKVYQITVCNMDALADSTDNAHDLIAMIMEPNKICSTYFRALDAVVKMMNAERKVWAEQGMLEAAYYGSALTAIQVNWEEATGEAPDFGLLYIYTTDALTGTAYQIHEVQVDA